jgi:hypothetical protein
MQVAGHPKMIETTLDLGSAADIFLKAETEHRHRCQPAVTASFQHCEAGRKASGFCSDWFG